MAGPKWKLVPTKKLLQQVAINPLMGAMLKERAEESAANTRRIAPVGASASGEHYVDQIDVVAKITSTRGGWLARVNAWKFTSGFLEFGTFRTPAFAPLRRGAELAGLVVKMTTKRQRLRQVKGVKLT